MTVSTAKDELDQKAVDEQLEREERENLVGKDTVESAGKPATTLEPVKMTEKSLI